MCRGANPYAVHPWWQNNTITGEVNDAGSEKRGDRILSHGRMSCVRGILYLFWISELQNYWTLHFDALRLLWYDRLQRCAALTLFWVH